MVSTFKLCSQPYQLLMKSWMPLKLLVKICNNCLISTLPEQCIYYIIAKRSGIKELNSYDIKPCSVIKFYWVHSYWRKVSSKLRLIKHYLSSNMAQKTSKWPWLRMILPENWISVYMDNQCICWWKSKKETSLSNCLQLCSNCFPLHTASLDIAQLQAVNMMVIESLLALEPQSPFI